MAEGARRHDRGQQALAWWRSIQRLTREGHPNPTADPGALAHLRRASTPLEAAQEAQTIALYRRLYGDRLFHDKLEAVAVLASTLAHVRENLDGDHSTAALLGTSSAGDQPVMSDVRFQRLCAARDGRAGMRRFREVVVLLNRRAPIPDLARSVLDWLDAERGDWRRTRWLFDYHGAGIAAPHIPQRRDLRKDSP